MTVAIIFGGKSSEHEVSVVSASSVVRNLPPNIDVVLIGISRDGEWFLQDEKMADDLRAGKIKSLSIEKKTRVYLCAGGKKSAFVADSGKTLSADVVFPVLHGQQGEDGAIQGALELAEIPYVGGGILPSAISFDKEKTKIIWKSAALPVVDGICVRKYDFENENFDKFYEDATARLGKNLFVKPCCAGSSVGAKKADTKDALLSAIKNAFRFDEKILVEKCVDAHEVECAVLGNEAAKSFEPGEIAPTHEFYDYDAKYNDPSGALLIIPAKIPEEKRAKIREIALKAYHALDLSGLSRVDFFVDKGTGEIFLNEVNTIPGFTSISMYPKMCETAGIPYPELLEMLLKFAIERFDARASLETAIE